MSNLLQKFSNECFMCLLTSLTIHSTNVIIDSLVAVFGGYRVATNAYTAGKAVSNWVVFPTQLICEQDLAGPESSQ